MQCFLQAIKGLTRHRRRGIECPRDAPWRRPESEAGRLADRVRTDEGVRQWLPVAAQSQTAERPRRLDRCQASQGVLRRGNNPSRGIALVDDNIMMCRFALAGDCLIRSAAGH
jgi:hypothetical protein